VPGIVESSVDVSRRRDEAAGEEAGDGEGESQELYEVRQADDEVAKADCCCRIHKFLLCLDGLGVRNKEAEKGRKRRQRNAFSYEAVQ
jgi:hypothetical protein